MIDLFAIGAVTGLVLAAVSLSGLWWTVRMLARSRVPWRLLTASAVVRLTLVALGLWSMSQIGTAALFGCITTLVAMRYLLTLVLSGTSMGEPGAGA